MYCMLVFIMSLSALKSLYFHDPVTPKLAIEMCKSYKHHDTAFQQLDIMVGRRAVANEVLLMLVDAGYCNLFLSNYIYGRLDSLRNVVVSVMDLKTYHVISQ